MKRQGDTVLDQPASKKSDNGSTDLRSKIGAKLSTFLNKISAANAERSKRQLYEDLFRDSTHSQIIIDPTIVVKIEQESDSDDCTEDASKISTQNFLTSAKSRLTELLHKRQVSEKENSPSSSGSAITSSFKSNTLQSISCNALNNRTKSSNVDSSDSSSPDIFISQKQLKNVCVLVEDVVKSGSINSIHSLVNQQTDSKICSLTVQNTSSESRKNILNIQKKHKNAKDNNTTNKEFTSNQKPQQGINELLDNVNSPSSSHSDSSFTNTERSASKNSSQNNVPKSHIMSKPNNLSLIDKLSNNILAIGDILIEKNETMLQSYAEDSEYVDDPVINITAASEKNEPSCIIPDLIQDDESPDEVVLLCEKRPTYEVITLEDDVIEDVHECPKCGKTFRAESLLNFHLRMHGSNSNESASVSLQEIQ